jgi:hypothetical protein
MAFTPRTETYINVSSLSTPYDASVTMPTGTVQDDIMFQLWGWSTATTIDSVPSGWFLVAQNIANTDRYALYFKIAGSGEAGPYVWSWTATAKVRGVCSVYTAGDFHVATGTLTDITVSNTQYRTSDGNIQAAAITVPFYNSPLLHFGMVYSVNSSISSAKPTTPTTGWVEDDNSWNTTSDFMWSVCSYIWTGVGTTGVMNAVLDASAVATTKHAFAIALRPKAFSLATETGAISEVGTAVGLKATRRLAAEAGSYSEVGTNVGLKAARKLAAGVGAYSEVGTEVVLRATRMLAGASGAYSMVGTAVGLGKGYPMVAVAGAFSLVGTDAGLKATRMLPASSGAFAWVGTDVHLHMGNKHMHADEPGEYLVAGQPVSLVKLHRFKTHSIYPVKYRSFLSCWADC